jgi:hypothetical protein
LTREANFTNTTHGVPNLQYGFLHWWNTFVDMEDVSAQFQVNECATQCTMGPCPDNYEGLMTDNGNTSTTPGDGADPPPYDLTIIVTTVLAPTIVVDTTTTSNAAEPAATTATGSHFARVKITTSNAAEPAATTATGSHFATVKFQALVIVVSAMMIFMI